MAYQLAFDIHIPDDSTFKTFYPGKNQAIVDYVKQMDEVDNKYDDVLQKQHQFTYIWGKTLVGKTHLLQACNHAVNQRQQSVFYLPLNNITKLTPKVFDGLESFSLICLDDIDVIAGQPQWEEAFFHLFNRLHESRCRLILTASKPPPQLSIQLADLKSRLSWCVVFQMQRLTDSGKIQAIKLHAEARGIKLSKEVGDFLLHRCSRDMNDLITILKKLDQVSLQQQRRLTIPFVKEVLEV